MLPKQKPYMPTLSADDIVQVRDIVSDEYEHYFERALL